MQYTTIALSLLAASGALAAPGHHRGSGKGGQNNVNLDKVIKVTLSGDMPSAEDPFTIHVPGKRTVEHVKRSQGLAKTIQVEVGKAVPKQDYRCQAIGEDNKPLVATRGENIDITFSDADKGPWTFRQPSRVKKVICDPAFAKIDPAEAKLTVKLSQQSTETGSQTQLAAGARAESAPVATSGPFDTVELVVGSLVEKQDYRCQITDADGKVILVTRGASVNAKTFADGDLGEWKFTSTAVHNIICDPTFVKGA